MVTDGTLRVTVGDEVAELGPGDFIAFSADRPHGYDVGDAPARGVMAMVYPEVPAPIWTAEADLPPATSGRGRPRPWAGTIGRCRTCPRTTATSPSASCSS